MTSNRRTAAIALSLVLGLVLLSLLALDRPLIRGDGLAYYMWLDSIAGDGDMDLTNQVTRFAHVNQYQVFYYPPTDAYASVFAYGGALLWAPFQRLAASLDGLGWLHVNDAHFWTYQGVLFPYSLLTMLGTNLMALASLVLAYKSARRFSGAGVSALVSLLLFWGTPALYYSTVEPLSVHIPGAFLVSLLIYGWLGYSEGDRWTSEVGPSASRGKTRAWRRVFYAPLFLGLVAGLATLVRWQLALYAVPIGLTLALRRRWRDLLLLGLGFLAFAWHLLYTWNWMFGSPLVVPAAARGQAGFLGPPVHLLKVLFSDERGLFVWSPITLLATLGLVGLARRRRELGLALLGMFALQALMNGAVADWWGGWSFGMRRMTELYPVFVVGLVLFLGRVPPFARRWSRLYRSGAWALALVAVGFSLLLLLSHLNFINTVRDQPQGAKASTEIDHQLDASDWRTTWLVIKDHYGIWAWHKPGP